MPIVVDIKMIAEVLVVCVAYSSQFSGELCQEWMVFTFENQGKICDQAQVGAPSVSPLVVRQLNHHLRRVCYCCFHMWLRNYAQYASVQGSGPEIGRCMNCSSILWTAQAVSGSLSGCSPEELMCISFLLFLQTSASDSFTEGTHTPLAKNFTR